MHVESKEYQSHTVFGDLAFYASFYEMLSMSIFSFITPGVNSVINIDSYTYSSMQGTLQSIRSILLAGRINDAYALLRKFYDSVTINLYSSLYLQEKVNSDTFVVQRIQEWINGTVQLPRYEEMQSYIRNAEATQTITKILLSDDRYVAIRNRCNAHTHYNFYAHVLLNDNEISLPNRLQLLDRFRKDIRDLIVLHFAYTFFLRDYYMASSDYLDALECGMQPEADSQYWVAPFVQEFFDEVITPYRPTVTTAIKDSSAMLLS